MEERVVEAAVQVGWRLVGAGVTGGQRRKQTGTQADCVCRVLWQCTISGGFRR